MAKKQAEAVVTETETKTAARGKKVMLTDPSTGETIARSDFIKQRYSENGGNRSAIVKELKEKFGHEVPYQIVFAATKPPKGDKANAPVAEAAE